MSPLDWAILVVLVLSVVSAFLHGLLVELFSVGGLIAGVAIAGLYYGQVSHYLTRWMPYTEARNAFAFLLVAIGIMIVAGLIARILRAGLRRAGLGGADRLAGAVFGFIRGSLLVTLGVMALLAFFPQQPWVRQSSLAPYFLDLARGGASWMPDNFSDRVLRGSRSTGNMEQPRP